MVTTKRLENRANFEQSSGGVALLERKAPVSYNELVSTETKNDESMEQARERMQRNLDKLLNYDRVEEKAVAPAPVAQEQKVEQVSVQEVKSEASLQEDDIRPTLTTMQFGEVDADTMRAEMRTEQTSSASFSLSGKGKIALVLYSLAVVVIMALIVLNTGVLSSLGRQNSANAQTLNSKKAEYSALVDQIDSISSDEYVIEQAEKMDMILR